MPKLLRAREPQDAAEERKVCKLAGSRHAPADWTQISGVLIVDETGFLKKGERSRPRDSRGAIIAKCSPGCFGSSEPVARDGTCRKRSTGRGGRCTDDTANGARKASGSA